ncbi:MAG: LLM class flavin-dependent oxidoreductase [Acidimicrobiales bacterium]
MRFGLFLAPFGEFADPRRVTGVATRAEEAGFDGLFLWDHVRYAPFAERIADPWVTLAAIAGATERLVIGPMVTPLARRRPHKLARETVTLDHLSNGRLVLGVGLGSERLGEFGPFGDEDDGRQRARRLDDGLELLDRYWHGELQPTPVQQPRIPVWVASVYPRRAPLRRAARWDGWFPIGVERPEQLAEHRDHVQRLRKATGTAAKPYDIAVQGRPGTDHRPWEEAGATWWLWGFGHAPEPSALEAAIAAGPPAS